jgi:hypothetical protein
MSKYIRDDKQFREQVAKLADAGLRLDRSIKTAREAMVEPPAYVRTIEPPTRRGHFNLPGLIVGLLYMGIVGTVLGLAVVGVIALIGGAH